MISPLSPSSPESEDSTSVSNGPGSGTCSCANRIPIGGTCCEHGSQAPSSTTTYAWSGEESNGIGYEEASPTLRTPSNGAHVPLIFSLVGSPAKTSPSPDDAEDSPATAPPSSSSSHGSQSLFDPDGYSSRTFQVSSLHKAVGTSEQSLERWPTSGTAWRGGFSTHVSSECRSDADGCSSSEPALTEILEPPRTVPAKYSLSARAAQGILRRAEKRGRTLPAHLAVALLAVAGGSGQMRQP